MKIELIFFRLRNQQFGMEIKSINRIFTSTVNKKSKKILFEKDEIPTIDLVSYLNLNNHKTKGPKELIVIESDKIKKGLLVDEILCISSLNLDKVKVLPSLIKNTANKDYFWAVAQFNDDLILLLDVRKLCLVTD